MKASRLVLPLCLFLSLSIFPARAADFYDIGPGARALGMGMAYTAVADDPFGMFFNPAGMANTPYTQAAGDFGRLDSKEGPLTLNSFAYVRPFDPINTATVGLGYYGERQGNGDAADNVIFNYSQLLRAPAALYLSRPLKVGGNFKILSVSPGPGSKSHIGLGFDGGVMADSNYGLKGGLSVTNFATGVGLPYPIISLGAAYTWRQWLTFASDLRMRSGLLEFDPGVEASLDQGLLKLRLGRGFEMDGVNTLAFGFGVDFSPLVIDAAMTVPWDGTNKPGGGYEVSVNYKFGAPSFSGNFVGQAAADASSLTSDIARLTQQKKDLESQAQAAATNNQILEGDADVLQKRIGELKDEYRLMSREKDVMSYELEQSKLQIQMLTPKPAPPAPKKRASAPRWPKTHAVQEGDTLRSLAQRYYGDPDLWEEIYRANESKFNQGLPVPGAVLTIPAPRQGE